MALTPRIADIAKGEPISARFLNQLIDSIIESIVGGEGIIVQRVGNRIIVSLAPNNRQIVPQ